MSLVTKARVIRSGSEAANAATRVVLDASRTPGASFGASPVAAKRVLEREHLATLAADSLVREAEAKADAIVEASRARSAEAAREAAEQAQANEHARFAAHYVALRAEDERRAERDRERLVATAVLLAERVIGTSIELDSKVVGALAREALAQVRRAKRVVVEAHPDDADAVLTELEAAGIPSSNIHIEKTPGLRRGDLSLHTDMGTVHARVTPQLERLARALHDALREP